MFFGFLQYYKCCTVTFGLKLKERYTHVMVFLCKGNLFYPIVLNSHSQDFFLLSFHLQVTVREKHDWRNSLGSACPWELNLAHYPPRGFKKQRFDVPKGTSDHEWYFVFASDMSSIKCVFGCEGKLTFFSFPKDRAVFGQWMRFAFPDQQHSRERVWIVCYTSWTTVL